MQGFELQTTEFDTTRTYKNGDYLKSPELGENPPLAPAIDAQTRAGMLTNDTVLYGAYTIVGIVSPGVAAPKAEPPLDEYNNKVLSFYTCYIPPVEATLATITTGVVP